jgi:hypothetical protein
MCDVSGCTDDAVVETSCIDPNCPDNDVMLACFAHQWMVCNPRKVGGW